MLSIHDIEAARARIADAIYESPCAYSETFSRLTGNKIFFKLENLQMTGSFKERGALNKLLTLDEAQRRQGVIAASAGNHAQGVAYHATRHGIDSTICMPLTTPLNKISATQQYGGKVVLVGANYDETFAEARRLADERGATLVHAFDDPAVIAGQGTLGLELIAQNPFLQAVVVPIGGGGLIAGLACAIKETNPRIRVIGVQTARLPSMRVAVAEGKPVELPAAHTIADGIGVRKAGTLTTPLVAKYVDEIVTVDEEEIANAILWLLEREKAVVEGAGAAATAALLQHKTSLVDKKVAVLVSGGNIDVNFLARIIERGLIKDGRLLRLRARTADHPGALHQLTGLLAAHRANILDLRHDRAHHGISLGESNIDVVLETRGPEHVDEIVAALRAAGYESERVR